MCIAVHSFRRYSCCCGLTKRDCSGVLPCRGCVCLGGEKASCCCERSCRATVGCFRGIVSLIRKCSSVDFRLGLKELGLKSYCLRLGGISLTIGCVGRYRLFFRRVKIDATLCCVSARGVRLTLLRGSFRRTHHLLSRDMIPPNVSPSVMRVHGGCLRRFCRRANGCGETCRCLREGGLLSSSVEGRHIQVHATSLALHCRRSSALVTRQILLRRRGGRILILERARFIIFTMTIMSVLATIFLCLCDGGGHTLLLTQGRHAISALHLRGVHGHLSPRFVFGVLGQRVIRQGIRRGRRLSSLMGLVHHGLRLTRRLYMALTRRLSFIGACVGLRHHSLNPSFRSRLGVRGSIRPRRVEVPSVVVRVPIRGTIGRTLHRGRNRHGL